MNLNHIIYYEKSNSLIVNNLYKIVSLMGDVGLKENKSTGSLYDNIVKIHAQLFRGDYAGPLKELALTLKMFLDYAEEAKVNSLDISEDSQAPLEKLKRFLSLLETCNKNLDGELTLIAESMFMILNFRLKDDYFIKNNETSTCVACKARPVRKAIPLITEEIIKQTHLAKTLLNKEAVKVLEEFLTCADKGHILIEAPHEKRALVSLEENRTKLETSILIGGGTPWRAV